MIIIDNRLKHKVYATLFVAYFALASSVIAVFQEEKSVLPRLYFSVIILAASSAYASCSLAVSYCLHEVWYSIRACSYSLDSCFLTAWRVYCASRRAFLALLTLFLADIPEKIGMFRLSERYELPVSRYCRKNGYAS